MLTFSNENIPKTRGSILIVCVLIIVAENYILVNTENVVFGGITLEITKHQFVSVLCIGLLYLWVVIIAQLLTGPLMDVFDRSNSRAQDRVSDEFTPPDDLVYKQAKKEMREDDPETQIRMIINKRTEKLRRSFKFYSSSVFIIPIIILTGFVWWKYDGFFRVFPAIVALAF